jgi:hypothetical protein
MSGVGIEYESDAYMGIGATGIGMGAGTNVAPITDGSEYVVSDPCMIAGVPLATDMAVKTAAIDALMATSTMV